MPAPTVATTAAAAVAAAKKNEARNRRDFGEKLPRDRRQSKSRAKITVTVRKRPMTPHEQTRGEPDILCVESKRVLTVAEPRTKVNCEKYSEIHHFKLDRVYDENTKNLDLYNSCIKPLVDAVFTDGGRCSCFAYGQTGSGKTHTMIGPAKLRNFGAKETNRDNKGVFELSSVDLIRWVQTQPFQAYGLFVSFFEIYCNKVYDLLQGRKLLRALETKTADGVVVKDLVSNRAETEQQLMKYIELGLSERIVGKNSRNADSSRGHAIFTVEVRHLQTQNLHGKLAFIDLAGSERGVDTLTAGRMTQQDGVGINRSLLALKECIRAMDLQSPHIPFRDSELTKVLRDLFLASSAQTVMIANVSPTASCCEQTLNTLRYAERVVAMRQRCKPCLNEDDIDDELVDDTAVGDNEMVDEEIEDDDDEDLENFIQDDEDDDMVEEDEGFSDSILDEDEEDLAYVEEEITTSRVPGSRTIIAELGTASVLSRSRRENRQPQSQLTSKGGDSYPGEMSHNSLQPPTETSEPAFTATVRPRKKDNDPRRPVTSASLKSTSLAASQQSVSSTSLQSHRSVTPKTSANEPPPSAGLLNKTNKLHPNAFRLMATTASPSLINTEVAHSSALLDGSNLRGAHRDSLTRAQAKSQTEESKKPSTLKVEDAMKTNRARTALAAPPNDMPSHLSNRWASSQQLDSDSLSPPLETPSECGDELNRIVTKLAANEKRDQQQTPYGSGVASTLLNPSMFAPASWIQKEATKHTMGGQVAGTQRNPYFGDDKKVLSALTSSMSSGSGNPIDIQSLLKGFEGDPPVLKTPAANSIQKAKGFLPARQSSKGLTIKDLKSITGASSEYVIGIPVEHNDNDIESLDVSSLNKLQSDVSAMMRERREDLYHALHCIIGSDSTLSLSLLEMANKFESSNSRPLLLLDQMAERIENLRTIAENKVAHYWEFCFQLSLFEKIINLEKRLDEAVKKKSLGSIEFYAATPARTIHGETAAAASSSSVNTASNTLPSATPVNYAAAATLMSAAGGISAASPMAAASVSNKSPPGRHQMGA